MPIELVDYELERRGLQRFLIHCLEATDLLWSAQYISKVKSKVIRERIMRDAVEAHINPDSLTSEYDEKS